MARQRPDSARKHPRIRSDGWTSNRQIGFLDALQQTRSVTSAAASVGMSRESAYRLRGRPGSALFAVMWDRALEPGAGGIREGDTGRLDDGRLVRSLGCHYRRKAGDFSAIGAKPVASHSE
jgi:hypothetical protein